MAIIGNDKDALLHGLSDFWLRYFKDVGDLEALYEGTEVLFGQAYLNLLSDVLNASTIETPLFRKEYYRPILISEDAVAPTGGDFPWTFTSETSFGRIPLLQNKVYAPTAALEEGIDYLVDGNQISFKVNPFDPLMAGFASRELGGQRQLSLWAVDAAVDDFDLYLRFGHFFADKRRSSEAYRMFVRGLMQLYLLGPAIERIESALNVVSGLPVIRDDGEVIVSCDSGAATSALDGVLLGTTFRTDSGFFGPTAVGGFITILGALELWNNNTYPVRAVSSDGHTLNLGGPAGSNAWPGFSEERQVSWEFSWSDKQTVTTNRNLYVLPRLVPLRSDLTPGLTMRAFEPLSTAVQVTDYISDPEWWHNVTIPAELWPDVSARYRTASPALAVGRIGCDENTGFARIGDPAFQIGPAPGFTWDEALQSYVNAALERVAPNPRYRNRAAFVLMDRVLKLHLFAVALDPSIETTGTLISDMRALLDEVKPTHTRRLHFETTFDMVEESTVFDLFSFHSRPIPQEIFEVLDNRWHVGELQVGQRFRYGAAGAVELLPDGSGTAIVVGGANPALQGNSESLLDLPVVLRVRSIP
jgi:hypothetical protein